MVVYIVFVYNVFVRSYEVDRVFADADDASDYCKKMNKKYMDVCYEYAPYKVN